MKNMIQMSVSHFYFMFKYLAQLWKINENGYLVNKIRNWKHELKNCSIPSEGEMGYIEILNGVNKVMELRNGLSANGTEVIFQSKLCR